jgi:hypothetical protein
MAKALSRPGEHCGKCHMGARIIRRSRSTTRRSTASRFYANRDQDGARTRPAAGFSGRDYAAAPTCLHLPRLGGSSDADGRSSRATATDVGLSASSWTLRPIISTEDQPGALSRGTGRQDDFPDYPSGCRTLGRLPVEHDRLPRSTTRGLVTRNVPRHKVARGGPLDGSAREHHARRQFSGAHATTEAFVDQLSTRQ